MRHTAVALLALLLPLLLDDASAQEPTEPPSVESARPLTLPTLRPPVSDTGTFSALALPPGTSVRGADGSPGRAYWQQRVDYRIRASLDTGTKRLTGSETISYTNNSPDSLRFLWFQLDQNLFRRGGTGALLFADERGSGEGGFEGGFEIDSVVQCRSLEEPQRGRAAPGRRRRARATSPPPRCASPALRTRVDNTMMYVELATPVGPSGRTVLELAYSFNIPEHGAGRMGRQGSLYQIGQWYPRLAVYDDVSGWNTDQYLGQGEFYLEYGTIEYEVTVPAGYIVAGTGTLQNPRDVLTLTQRQRLTAALKSDTTIGIVTSEELSSGTARPTRAGSLTWRFKADNVRDAAWAASPEYLWDATGWEGILAHAYYRPPARETWQEAAQMSRYSIQEYSTRWLSYPYPQISVVEGPLSGVEYPMVTMGTGGSSGPDLYATLTHGIGHMWYPATVGSNGRRDAWMSEGLNTFIATFSEEGYWKRDDSGMRQRERQLVIEADQLPTAQPILTPPNRYRTSNSLLTLASLKPAMALLSLRSKVLGPQAFDSALREYTRRWAFKHPTPADFFRTVEEVSGRDLAWFWRSFFFTTAALDQSVESVKQDSAGAQVTLVNLGDAVMPVELELGFEEAGSELVKLPVEIWYGGNRFVYQTPAGKTVVSARVNPDGTLPDAVPTNDQWKRPATTATP